MIANEELSMFYRLAGGKREDRKKGAFSCICMV